jgi:surface polysaccharide O-acyltransferase-like enzyme
VRPTGAGDPTYGAAYSGDAAAFLGLAGHNFLTGEAMFHLWYMPVLAILFVATPLISAALDNRYARWLVLILALAPLAASRTGAEFGIASSLYFLGTYAVGIAVGRNYESWLAWLESMLVPLAGVALVATLLFPFLGRLGLQQVGFWSPAESLFYIQKLALAGIALVLLRRWEDRLPRWLDLLATYAFAIYFLHAPVIQLLRFTANSVLDQHSSFLGTLGLCLVWLTVSIGVSVAITWLVRKIFGKRSRMIVGA